MYGEAVASEQPETNISVQQTTVQGEQAEPNEGEIEGNEEAGFPEPETVIVEA
jgi:hypothetical protein